MGGEEEEDEEEVVNEPFSRGGEIYDGARKFRFKRPSLVPAISSINDRLKSPLAVSSYIVDVRVLYVPIGKITLFPEMYCTSPI